MITLYLHISRDLSLYFQPILFSTILTSQLCPNYYCTIQITWPNIILLNTDVSLEGTDFYILSLIMVFSMFHISLVFKSCTFYVLVQFWYQLSFATSCSLNQVFSLFFKNSFLAWNWKNGRAGQHSTYAEVIVLLLPSLIQFWFSWYWNIANFIINLTVYQNF